jgi:cytochrome c
MRLTRDAVKARASRLFAAHEETGVPRLCSCAVLLLFLIVLAGCSDYPRDRAAEAKELMAGGDPVRGRSAIRRYGCGTCHTIPGVRGATANVGPPLDKIALRGYLAGRLPNTPGNLLLWIRAPRSVDAKTAMPDMGVSERDGRDIAAYLLTLR